MRRQCDTLCVENGLGAKALINSITSEHRHHLLIKCRQWTPEIKRMWQRVRAESGWGGAPSIHRLFGDERNVKAILEFLEETRVEGVPGRVLLAGGPDLEEEEMEGFSLQVLGEEEIETEVSSSEYEDGPGPPI